MRNCRLLPALLPLLLACSETAPSAPLGQKQQPASIEGGWVGTWAVAPQGDNSTFQDKTIRHIVHTSIGGGSVRIRVSNVFGSGPLTLDSAFIAKRVSGSSIAPASSQALKFGGQASVSIPAGQSALSDAVAFVVEPLSDLAVSFHLPSTPSPATAHGTGTQDNYVANGNVADDESLSGAQTRGSYFFLTNVDVQNPAAWGAVVTLGASITDGVQSSQNANRRWPNYLAKRLADANIPVGVLNQGISGNKLLVDGAGESALKRFERDVIAQSGVRWVIFSDDPINDLGAGNPPSGPQLIDGLKQLVAQAHAAELEFWCSTLTPFEGSGGWKPQGETARAAIHTFIKGAESGCDAIVDQDSATHDPAKPTWYLPAFDAGDHLHPNEQGMQAIAQAVPLDGFSAPASTGGAGGEASGGSAGSSAGGSATGGTGSGSAGVPTGGAGSPGSAGLGAGPSGSGPGGGSGGGPTSGSGGAASGSAPSAKEGADGSGCSCRAPGGTTPRSTLAALLLFAVVLSRLGRRRR